MEANYYYRYQFRRFGRFCSKLFWDFISGIPRDDDLINTGISGFRPLRRPCLRSEAGCSAYHPVTKPGFKKATLSKEKKKEKSH